VVAVITQTMQVLLEGLEVAALQILAQVGQVHLVKGLLDITVQLTKVVAVEVLVRRRQV
jgi:hypothetical protein